MLFNPFYSQFFNLQIFCFIAVVRQVGIQGDTVEVGWIIQEEF